MTPVSSNGSGPGTFSARQPSSTCSTSGGTASSGQTIDSSSGVRVIETSDSCSSSAQDGIRAVGGRRQIASGSGSTVRSMRGRMSSR